ncbi:GNAT family N-acetyltransferase [Candidatus Pelagibacter sp.]|nr:GNAT family N-acetyltransferase [Candidatus Pelagibacter sp.]
MKFYKKVTLKLKKKDILDIAKLKNSHWNFGISSQLAWFKDQNNVFDNDFHLFLKKKEKIIGYVQLGKRKYILNSKKKNYYLFRTLIVLKKERNEKLANKIMHEVSNFIRQKRAPSFLLCKKNLIKFYEKYGWIKLNKKKFKVQDHKSLLHGMIYNLRKTDQKKIKFYYNEE